MQEKIQFTSKVISLGSQENDLYMELSMVFLDDIKNLNDVIFTKDFLTDVETNKSQYIGLPLVGDMNALTSGKYQNLTHLFDKKTGIFSTQALGSFVDFKTEINGGITQLIAISRVWKRYPKVCLAMQELFDSAEGLSFSYEVLVGKYTVESGVKVIDKDETNTIASSCVVSNPANPNSIALTLCAAIEEDLINNQSQGNGGNSMIRTKDVTFEEMFAETKVVLTEIAELDLQQIQRKIYTQLKDICGDEWWNFDIKDQGIDYIVLSDYSSGNYFKIDYTVTDSDVVLSNMRQTTKTWEDVIPSVPACPNYDASCPQCLECDQTNLEEEDTMAGTCIKKTVAELDAEILTLNATIETNKTELASVNEKLAAKVVEATEKDSKIEVLSASVIEKDKLLTEMEPIKVEYEKIIAEKSAVEIAEKKVILKDKYSKLLDEATLAKPEIAEAIEKLDETVLKDAYIEIAMAKATKDPKKIEVASTRATDTIVIAGGTDIISKYITLSNN